MKSIRDVISIQASSCVPHLLFHHHHHQQQDQPLWILSLYWKRKVDKIPPPPLPYILWDIGQCLFLAPSLYLTSPWHMATLISRPKNEAWLRWGGSFWKAEKAFMHYTFARCVFPWEMLRTPKAFTSFKHRSGLVAHGGAAPNLKYKVVLTDRPTTRNKHSLCKLWALRSYLCLPPRVPQKGILLQSSTSTFSTNTISLSWHIPNGWKICEGFKTISQCVHGL